MRHAEQDALIGGIYRWFAPHETQLVSKSLDEIRSLSAREIGPQRYELRSPTKAFSSRIQFSPSTDVTLSYASFSSALEITSAPSKPNYVLFFRLRGSSEYTVHRRVFTTSPLIGALLPGMQPARVLTNEDWHVFGTRFAPDTLQRELSQMLDRQILRP